MYGWMKKTKDKHCKSCYENVYERDNTIYFKYICMECQTMHLEEEVLGYEEVMNILLNDSKPTNNYVFSNQKKLPF